MVDTGQYMCLGCSGGGRSVRGVLVRHTRPSKFSLCSSEAPLGSPVVALAAQEWPLRPRDGLCGPEMD